MLKAEGVKYLWTLSGGHNMALYEHCIPAGIKIIDARHEQAAGHMAEGWAKVTATPGVCAVTAGPGVTDVVSAVANAYQAASPMIVLGGRAPVREWESGALQDMDQVALLSSITKWCKGCLETRRLPEYVSMAFRHALSGKPGPVYLDLPLDILIGKVEEDEVFFPVKYRTESRPQGDPELVKQAVELLVRAKKPLIIAGGGVFWSQAGKELADFVTATQIPVFTNSVARGIIPDDHPLCLGTASPLGGGAARFALPQADVILVIGDRFNFMLGYGRPPVFGKEVKLIQIDIDPSEIGRNRPVDIGIVGDARAVLQQMTQEVRESFPNKEWLESLRQMEMAVQRDLEPLKNSEKEPIHPLRLAREVFDFIDRDAVWIADGGDCATFAQQVARAYLPGHSPGGGPFGLLGVGIPYAIAAKAALPDKQVIVLQGDGSFGLNGMEMDTAIRFNLPIVVVIFNDGAWGMVKHGQEMWYGADRVFATELGRGGKLRRYDQMVAGLGGYGEFVERPGDIRPALERAFASGVPACINVRVDPTAVSAATKVFMAQMRRLLGKQ
jgi:acetolactate synthase-1/2/3 large subunit